MFGPSHIIVSCKNMKTLQEIKSTTQTEHSKRGRLTLPLFDFILPGREVNNQEARRPQADRETKKTAVAVITRGARPSSS
ncbi:predicted protein [Brucella sp. 83/13]|nr:predicted protein [Brucella sp. 83/13]